MRLAIQQENSFRMYRGHPMSAANTSCCCALWQLVMSRSLVVKPMNVNVTPKKETVDLRHLVGTEFPVKFDDGIPKGVSGRVIEKRFLIPPIIIQEELQSNQAMGRVAIEEVSYLRAEVVALVATQSLENVAFALADGPLQ